MTMTETKLSDEEIQGLIKKNLRAVRAESVNIAIFDQNAEALRQLQAENKALSKGIEAVADLISDSHGVTGLHLNGDVAPWDELRTGGRFEDWLADFDAALQQEKGDG